LIILHNATKLLHDTNVCLSYAVDLCTYISFCLPCTVVCSIISCCHRSTH